MNEVKETEGEKRVMLAVRVKREKAEQFRAAARSADISTAAWLTMAANSYLSGWRDPDKLRKSRMKKEDPVKRYPSGWPMEKPCPFAGCGKAHDPAPHPWWAEEWQKLVDAEK